MISIRASSRRMASQKGLLLSCISTTARSTRLYSSQPQQSHEHGQEHDDHGHGHDDHGHHETPLSEPEQIFNKYTLGVAGVFLSVYLFDRFNTEYKSSHEGKPILSLITDPKLTEKVDLNTLEYAENVRKETEFHKMMAYRDHKTPSNLVTSIRDIPGRVMPFGGNSEFNTIRDFKGLSERKIPENPFKID